MIRVCDYKDCPAMALYVTTSGLEFCGHHTRAIADGLDECVHCDGGYQLISYDNKDSKPQ